ncbi:hypothetical protein KUTeg_001354 [Tegillarca granosa]|uniref:VPS9 domain-containing protein n=1 Tax=Tegillarca granosa TaxID=220873 RepID=A0ABQ9FUX7_TEGGR|nr:hypothetical protein KUTeg_001354 [Tegillarca granosa]
MQGKRDEEKDGQVTLWQGYYGNEVEVVTFPIFSNKQIFKVALGGEHSLFLTKNGEVYTCGENKHGQLGIGSLEPQYIYDPVHLQFFSDKSITDIGCGTHHSAAVTSTGQVYCWGDSSSGQCGIDKSEVTTPYLVKIQSESLEFCEHGVCGPSDDVVVTQVACGQSHTVALSSEKELWVWGSGLGLGLGGVLKSVTPQRLDSLCGRNVLSICSGDNFCVAIVEKSILDEGGTASNRQSVSSLETKIHKNLPDTCAKCNAEIYSYEETLDTCIINTHHKCGNQPINDFESSIQSFDGLGNGNISADSLNQSGSGASNKDQDKLNKENTEVIGKNDDASTESSKKVLSKTGEYQKEDPSDNVKEQNNEESKEDKTEGLNDGLEQKQKCDNKSEIETCSDETEKLQSDIQNKTDDQDNNFDTRSVKVGRSQSFLDEIQARKYLAKQIDPDDKTTHKPAFHSTVIENIWSSLPTSPSNVLQQVSYIPQQVTSMTSKAISNIRSSVSDKLNFVSGQTAPDSKSETSSDSADAQQKVDTAVSENDESSEKVCLRDKESVSMKKFVGDTSYDESFTKIDESSFIDKINEYIPGLDSSREDLHDGEITPNRKSQSVKTVWAKQEKLEKRESLAPKTGSTQDLVTELENVILETEVWVWGKNTKGQLGVGDMIDRATPHCVKLLNGKHVIKVAAGANHALALTSYSQVYSWGLNSFAQLGHSEDSSKPSRIKLMAGCYVWDIGAGNTYSIFLIDRTGFQPEVHYLGKHPSKDLYVPINKTSRLTMLTFLKQAGWIRSVVAGGDNCAVISCWSFSGHTATVFEFVATERRFYHYLSKIVSLLILQLQKSSFYTTLDVYPYKSTLQNLLCAFQKVTTLIGQSVTEFTRKVWHGDSILQTSFFCSYSKYTDEFKKYSIALGDMIAINGFDYLTKVGSSFFDKAVHLYQRILEEKVEKSANHSNGDDFNLLEKVSLNWDSLRHSINIEQSTAESTKLFWKDSNQQRLADALKIPSRRLIRDSKTHPLTLEGGGRFSTHIYLLFNDMFVHVYSSTFQVFHLDTLWVEATSGDNEKQQNSIIITSPEEKFTVLAQSPATKVNGEMKWKDGRSYVGNFKLGFQHGYGKLMIPQDDGSERVQQGNWKDGRLHGLGKVKYSNGDVYEGYFKEGERHGHGVYSQGKYTSNTASVYIGEWLSDKRNGYGVLDDILKGEGLIVTLDGMYFEGNFTHDKLTGFGLMLTDDNSSYEGEFSGITQLQGKGLLTMPTGDQIEGMFNGSWNEGLKINGTFNKCSTSPSVTEKKSSRIAIVSSKYYGKFSVKAERKWNDLFQNCHYILGYKGQGKPASEKAWEVVAVMVSKGKRRYLMSEKTKSRRSGVSYEDLEKIPPHNVGKLTVEKYHEIVTYLTKAFDATFHPLGKLMEGLVDVFRASYIGVGAHPRLLFHAVQEVKSCIDRLYKTVSILFPDLPANGGPLQIMSECKLRLSGLSSTDNMAGLFQRQTSCEDEEFEVVSAGGLLHPILLPKIYPPLFDLYALYNDREDEKYWERIQRLNKQGDMALMAYLGIEQKFWLIDENMFRDKKLSSLRDHCYLTAVDTLQQISTAFSPKEKLQVIHNTFIEITKSVQTTLGEDYMWCMDELFPIFQYVVVRAKIRHLGAEIHLIEDLMERYLENGELGIMFTTLYACYFQIHNEKLPSH